MKLHDSRMRTDRRLRLQILGMQARTAHTGEIQVIAGCAGHLEISRNQFNLRIDGFHLLQCSLPIVTMIIRAGILSQVLAQGFE